MDKITEGLFLGDIRAAKIINEISFFFLVTGFGFF